MRKQCAWISVYTHNTVNYGHRVSRMPVAGHRVVIAMDQQIDINSLTSNHDSPQLTPTASSPLTAMAPPTSKSLKLQKVEDKVLGAFSMAPTSDVLDHLVRYLSSWRGSEWVSSLKDLTQHIKVYLKHLIYGNHPTLYCIYDINSKWSCVRSSNTLSNL